MGTGGNEWERVNFQGATAMNEFTPGAAICPSCGNGYFKDQPWKRTCLKCYLKAKGKTYTPPPVPCPVMTNPIEPDMLKRLIYLVHPDKHANSEASNIATRFLLQLREVQHG